MYPERRRLPLYLVISFGFLGAGVGALLTAFFPIGIGPERLFHTIACSTCGVMVGTIFGGILSLFIRRPETTDGAARTHTGGPQLVGEICVLCGKPIQSIVGAEFCSECRAPVHQKCIVPQVDVNSMQCPRCGASPRRWA